MGRLGRTIDRLPQRVKDGLVRDQAWTSKNLIDQVDITPDMTVDKLKKLGNPKDNREVGACFAGQVIRHGDFNYECQVIKNPGARSSLEGTGRAGHNSAYSVVMEFDDESVEKFREFGLHRIGPYFDKLCRRFGLERIVRCVKLRAARGNRPETVLEDSNEHEKEAVRV